MARFHRNNQKCLTELDFGNDQQNSFKFDLSVFLNLSKFKYCHPRCLCLSMEPDTCFTNPYYRSPDYLTRYPAYLRRVAPPPTKVVDVEELLYPRKFCVQKCGTSEPADDRIEDILQYPGGQSSVRKTVASRVPKKTPKKVSKKRKTRDFVEKGNVENHIYHS